MWLLLLLLGFVQFYAYDINSVTKQYKWATHLFFTGACCVSVSAIGFMVEDFRCIPFGASVYLALLGFVLSFALLIYTLFFALPFDDTYRSDQNQLCDTGMYALCRHPGVIWFFFVFLCLVFVFQTKQAILFGLLAHTLNFIYVVLQDCVIFPVLFPGYDTYKKTTPFLLPNRQSIRKCLATIRR